VKYNATITDHFEHPRNCCVLPDANAVGEAINEVCMDRVRLYLRVEVGRVAAASFQVEGCVPTIAAASMLTEYAAGKPLEQLRALTAAQIEQMLGGLPATKKHAAYVAAEALRAAVGNSQGG
jgi:NifU-like protein involved in Fe-S cluster formation